MPSIISAMGGCVRRKESDNYTGHVHLRASNLAVAEEGKFTRVLRYKDYANMKEKATEFTQVNAKENASFAYICHQASSKYCAREKENTEQQIKIERPHDMMTHIAPQNIQKVDRRYLLCLINNMGGKKPYNG